MTEHLGGPETPERLAQRHARYAMPDSRQFRIVDQADRSVGYVGYWERSWRDDDVWEVGWAVLPEFQGRGYATAAMRLPDVIRVPSRFARSRLVGRQRRLQRGMSKAGVRRSRRSRLRVPARQPDLLQRLALPSGQSNGCSKVELAASEMVGRSRIPSVKTVTDTRKVRAPRRRVAGNTRPPKGEDQRHRDEPAASGNRGGPGETGKLYLEQGQIGEQSDFGSAGARRSARAGRLKTSGNRRRRWMTVPDRKVGTELGLQTVSLAFRASRARVLSRSRAGRFLVRARLADRSG